MSTLTSNGNIAVVTGDLLASRHQAIVNTVNTVGVMGKGIALQFKKRYPEMFEDYVKRCERGEVKLGQPYVFRVADHLVVNFPTKGHWRSVSKLTDIVAGLEYLEAHYRDWGITSIAVPPLGCGNGQLEWEVVGPTLIRHLARLEIPVELYAPAGSVRSGMDSLFDVEPVRQQVPPEWLAVVAVLDRLQRQPLHWPVGRVMFQKLAYFATVAGIPTGLTFERGAYGPFSADLKRRIAQLENNGLAAEVENGRMLEVRVGSTYADAVADARERMEPSRAAVERTVDLMARMNTRSSEIAATVHFVIAEAERASGATPTVSEVRDRVNQWKPGKISDDEIVDAVALLCMRGWSRVVVDDESRPRVEARLSA